LDSYEYQFKSGDGSETSRDQLKSGYFSFTNKNI